MAEAIDPAAVVVVSISHNDVLQVAQRNISIVAHTQHRVRSGEYGLLYTAAGRIKLKTGAYLPGCRVNKHMFTRKSGG